MSSKIQPTHLQRRAIVYLRQSTLKQLHEHRESTVRQYALRQRAIELGWPDEQVQVIDEDLGQSGSSAQWRTGFQRLAEDVAHGQVGAIFALEASRLARSSADWHRLLDLCGLTDVVIIDERAVYMPRDYNDRLLLGLQGTMSEAEQYWMRLRLQGGKLSKARRGELYFAPPIGYQWDETSARFRLDPDEQVQGMVRLVFERFRLDGSAYAVMRYCSDHNLTMPMREPVSQQIRQVHVGHSLVLGILHNPLYTGTYVFGRREERLALVNGRLQRRRVSRLPQETWKVRLPDRHPAYLTWEEFMANQRKLDENRTYRSSMDRRGAAREGGALLQGLVLCGRCGLRMTTRYQGTHPRPQYECRSATRRTGQRQSCWTVPARMIDQSVTELFLRTLTPPEIELALAVANEVEQQLATLQRQWKARLDRARYHTQLAERRYKAVDPDNRVVVRTLEREWNDALRELDQVERDYQDAQRRQKMDLSEHDRAQILALCRDLPRVWNAETTTHAERKNLLRILIREITLSPIDLPERRTRIQLLWQTGAVSDWTVVRHNKYTARCTSPEIVEYIRRRVITGAHDVQIAAELNERGWRTGVDRAWDEKAVSWVRGRHRLRCPQSPPRNVRMPDQRDDGLYSVHGVAARFGVTEHIVRYWILKGWLQGTEGGGALARTWWFQLDNATVARLEQAKARGYGPKRHRDSKSHMKKDGHYA